MLNPGVALISGVRVFILHFQGIIKNGKLSDSRFQMLSDDYEQEQEELREKLLDRKSVG